DHLIAHELAVVFAECAGNRAITRVGEIRAARPLPHISEHLEKPTLAVRAHSRRGMKVLRIDEVSPDRHPGGRVFPFKLSRKTRPGPIRVCICLEVAHMGDGFRFIYRSKSGEGEIPPGVITLYPVNRRFPPA